MPAIEIRDLTKDYRVGLWRKRRLRALDNLTLSVESGEVFGFLGPNGAGKTTTLKLLMNLIHPTSGSALILGEPAGSFSMRGRIGYLPENPYFYDYLTAEEFLTYAGSLFGIPNRELKKKVRDLLEKVGLDRASNVQLRKFSKGMVQRIGIAQAIINDPAVIFLDEPMSGLDPLGRREVRQIIDSFRSRGVTVFFCSHILPDVEALCDQVAILNQGKLRDVGYLSDILKAKIDGHDIILTRTREGMLEALRGKCDEITRIGDRIHVRAATVQTPAIISYAVSLGAELVSVNPIRSSLEDYFLHEIQTPEDVR